MGTDLSNLFNTTGTGAAKKTDAQTYMEAYSKNPNTFTPLSMSSDSYISSVSNKMNVADSFYDAGMSDDDVAKYMYIHDQSQQGKGLSEIESVLSDPKKANQIVTDYQDVKAGYDTYLKDQNLFNEMSAETMAKYDVETHYKNFMAGGDSGVRDMASKLAGMNSVLRQGTKLGMSDVIKNNQHDLKGTMFDESMKGQGSNGASPAFNNKLDTASLKAKGLSDDDIKKMQGDEEYFYNVLNSLKTGHEENREKGFWEKVGDWFKAVGTSLLHGAWDIISSPFQIVNAIQASVTGERWDDPASTEMNKWVASALKGHAGWEKTILGAIDGVAEFAPAIALEVMSAGADTPAFLATSASIFAKAGMIMPTVSGVQSQALAINKEQGKTGIGDNLGAFGKAITSGLLFAAAGKLTGAGFGKMPGIKNLMGAEAGNLFAGRTLAKLGAGSLENMATMYGLGRANDFLVNVGSENVGSSFLRMLTPTKNGQVDTEALSTELINAGISGTIFSAGSLFKGTRNANKLVKSSYEDMAKYSPSIESIKNDFMKNGMQEIQAQDATLEYLSNQGADVSTHIQRNAAKIYGEKVSQSIENSITTSKNMLDGYLKTIYDATGDERFSSENSKLNVGDAMSHMLKYGFPTTDEALLTEKGFIKNEDFKNLLEINDIDPSRINVEEVKNKKGKVLRKRPLLQKSTSQSRYERLSEKGKRSLDGISGDAKIKKLNYMASSKENENIATGIRDEEPITNILKDNNKSFADIEKDFGESNPWTTEEQIGVRKEHEEFVSELKGEIGKSIATGDMKALESLIKKTSMEDIHSLYEGKKITAPEYSKLLDVKEVYDSASEVYKGSKDTVNSIQDVSVNEIKDIDKFEKIIDNKNIDDKFIKENLDGEQQALFNSVGNKVDLFDRIKKLHDNNDIEKQFKKDVKKLGFAKAVEKMNATVKAKETAPTIFEPTAEGKEEFDKERKATVKREEKFNKVETAKALKEAKRQKLLEGYEKADKKGNGQDYLDYVDKYLKDNEGKTPTFESYNNQKAVSDWFEKVKAMKELEAGKDVTVFDESEVKLSNSKAAIKARAKTKKDAIANAKVGTLVVKGEVPAEDLNNAKDGATLDKKLKEVNSKVEVNNKKESSIFDFEYEKEIKESYGKDFIIKNMDEAMWVTPDGNLINGVFLNGSRSLDHRNVLIEDNNIGLITALEAGSIRVSHETNSIETIDGTKKFLTKKSSSLFDKYTDKGFGVESYAKQNGEWMLSDEQKQKYGVGIEDNPFKPEATKKAKEVKAILGKEADNASIKKDIKVTGKRTKELRTKFKKLNDSIPTEKELKKAKSNVRKKGVSEAGALLGADTTESDKVKNELYKMKSKIEKQEIAKKDFINNLSNEEIASLIDWNGPKNIKEEYYEAKQLNKYIDMKKEYSSSWDHNKFGYYDLGTLELLSPEDAKQILISKLDKFRKETKQSKTEKESKAKQIEKTREEFAKRAKAMRDKQLKEQKQKVVKLKTRLLDDINVEQDLHKTFKSELEGEGIESVDSSVKKGDTIHSVITLGEEANFAIKKVGDDYIANIWGSEENQPEESNWLEVDNGSKLYSELESYNLSKESEAQLLDLVNEKIDNLEANKKAIGNVGIEDIIDENPIPKNLKDKYFSKFDNWEDALNEIDKVADEEVKNSGDLEFERKVCK